MDNMTVSGQGYGEAKQRDHRSADLAVTYAAPALLAVRDWLLVALAFSSGIYSTPAGTARLPARRPRTVRPGSLQGSTA
jgi:hypothetical protein